MPKDVYMPGDGSSFAGDGTTYELPYLGLRLINLNGFYFTAPAPVLMTAAVVADPRRTANFGNFETLIAAITFFRAQTDYNVNVSAWQDSHPTAMECGQYLCLKALNSSVMLGNLSESILNTSSVKVPASWQPTPKQPPLVQINNTNTLGTLDWNPLYHPNYVSRNEFQLDPSGFDSSWFSPDETFNASQTAVDSTINLFLSLFNKSADEGTPTVSNYTGQTTYTSDLLQPFYESNNLTETFQGIAESLTDTLRNAGDTSTPGLTSRWIIRYRIRWAFLAVPVAFITSMFSWLLIFEFCYARCKRELTN